MPHAKSLLYSCGCAAAAPVVSGASRLAGVIDLHCHVITPEVDSLVRDRSEFAALVAAMRR